MCVFRKLVLVMILGCIRVGVMRGVNLVLSVCCRLRLMSVSLRCVLIFLRNEKCVLLIFVFWVMLIVFNFLLIVR